jgi:hypothetical protein
MVKQLGENMSANMNYNKPKNITIALQNCLKLIIISWLGGDPI